MKNRLEKVYSKLPKVELEKVELATQKQVFAITEKLLAAQRDIDKGRDKLNTSYPQALKIISEIEGQAKELGIKADDIKGFKSLNIEAKNTKSQYL